MPGCLLYSLIMSVIVGSASVCDKCHYFMVIALNDAVLSSVAAVDVCDIMALVRLHSSVIRGCVPNQPSGICQHDTVYTLMLV